MQNTANQNKRLAIEILCSASGYLSVFGNNPANGLVTEILQYSVQFCFFNIQQNRENQFILNKLRSICTVLFWVAFWGITHIARHTYATIMLTKGVSIESVSKMLGHTNITTTQIYAKVLNQKIVNEVNRVRGEFDEMKSFYLQR